MEFYLFMFIPTNDYSVNKLNFSSSLLCVEMQDLSPVFAK